MGFLDHLFTDIGNAAAGHESQLAPMLLSALGGGDNQTAQANGLTSLIGRFQKAGLGDVVQSWISNQQPNQPVTPDQVQHTLGEEHIAALANKAGLPKSALLPVLATMLPKLIDGLTPNGQVPTAAGAANQTAASPAQTPGEAEAPDSTGGGTMADAVGQTDPTEPVQAGTERA